MRVVIAGLAALLALSAVPARAMVPAQPVPSATSSQPNIIYVDRRCGRGRHYVRGHYNRYHRYVRGRCVWNRRRY